MYIINVQIYYYFCINVLITTKNPYMRPLLLEIIVWELKWHETGKPCTISGPGNKLKRVFYGKLTTPNILSVSPLTTKEHPYKLK